MAVQGKGGGKVLVMLPGPPNELRPMFSEQVIPRLAARGLLLAGIDVIGDCVTEINVTSPTCFQEIFDQTGFDVAAMFVDALEAALALPRQAG